MTGLDRCPSYREVSWPPCLVIDSLRAQSVRLRISHHAFAPHANSAAFGGLLRQQCHAHRHEWVALVALKRQHGFRCTSSVIRHPSLHDEQCRVGPAVSDAGTAACNAIRPADRAPWHGSRGYCATQWQLHRCRLARRGVRHHHVPRTFPDGGSTLTRCARKLNGDTGGCNVPKIESTKQAP